MPIQIPYYKKKEAIIYMINHYENNCLNYLTLDMPVNDIEFLYDFDMEYVEHYKNELKLLEQITYN